MARIVTMHQPNYLPWIGLFSKIARADCFIIYDSAQYVTSSIINRNRIRVRNGSCFLTIPISNHFRLSRINEVFLPDSERWKKDHWQTIYQNYANARYFKDYKGFFQDLYQGSFRYLWEINEKVLFFLLDCFDIKVEVLRSSSLPVDQSLHGTDMIIACTKGAGADTFLSGPSGKNYLEFEKFPPSGVTLKFFNFQHPVYRQRYPGFEPNMAAIDLLFNMGPASAEIIRESGSIADW